RNFLQHLHSCNGRPAIFESFDAKIWAPISSCRAWLAALPLASSVVLRWRRGQPIYWPTLGNGFTAARRPLFIRCFVQPASLDALFPTLRGRGTQRGPGSCAQKKARSCFRGKRSRLLYLSAGPGACRIPEGNPLS